MEPPLCLATLTTTSAREAGGTGQVGNWAPPTSDPEAEGEGEVRALGVSGACGGVISGSEGPLLASNCAESCMSDCMMAEMAFSWDCSLLEELCCWVDGSGCRFCPAIACWPIERAGDGCCGVWGVVGCCKGVAGVAGVAGAGLG